MGTLAKRTLIVFAIAAGSVMTKAQTADSIVGTWRLVSFIEEETESKAVHKTFGDNPLGLLTYSRVTSSPPFCSAHSCWLPPVDGAESG
jgi:hypothetical protein